MDPVVQLLLNNSAYGILAGVLYLLHTQALKAFREQQKEEREMFRVTSQHALDLALRHHEEVMQAIRDIAPREK